MRADLAHTFVPLAIVAAFAAFFVFQLLRLYAQQAFQNRSQLDQEMLQRGESVLLGQPLRQAFVGAMAPVLSFLEKGRIHPNTLTVTCLFLSAVAGGLIAFGELAWGGVIGLAGSSLDYLDGRLARQTGRSSPAGAFLDSTLDRYCDIAFLTGAGIFYREAPIVLVACFVGLGSSLVISYTRAKAESLGADLKVGLMQRPERVALFCLGALLSPVLEPFLAPLLREAWKVPQAVFAGTLVILAVLATITTAQRTFVGFRGLQSLPTERRDD